MEIQFNTPLTFQFDHGYTGLTRRYIIDAVEAEQKSLAILLQSTHGVLAEDRSDMMRIEATNSTKPEMMGVTLTSNFNDFNKEDRLEYRYTKAIITGYKTVEFTTPSGHVNKFNVALGSAYVHFTKVR